MYRDEGEFVEQDEVVFIADGFEYSFSNYNKTMEDSQLVIRYREAGSKTAIDNQEICISNLIVIEGLIKMANSLIDKEHE